MCTCFFVEDGGSGILYKVLADDFVFAVAQDVLHFLFTGILDGLADLLPLGLLFEFNGEVHDADIEGGDSKRHAGELALEFWDDESDSLGGP